ncbi:hypothetical protein LOTGIDRAFT_238732 [Lottia gigantea]|uniref:Uncharacterized protein n=1 Tax=Lottia gigantea TaxID=225164 RepID=V4AR55_LOTGI|nr:hypothetical protein LOTGIDRAFT_238732 [Lottia gigantea]ESO99732.1 hypothetical protein LOTGIDRAFT_238732 [Lottia gigantea]
MILEAVIEEKKFSGLSPLKFEDLFDMDEIDESASKSSLQDDIATSSISQPTCSKYGADFSPISVCIELSDSDSSTCSSQSEILARRKKTAQLSKNLSRLKIEKSGKEPFLNYLGLVPNAKAISIQNETEHKDVADVDCEIIGVEGLDECDNVPMTSPRTPHSLMSQLSRDVEGSARKRLFSLSESVDRLSDSELHDSGIYLRKTSIQGSLLGIDFSSYLGQRIRRHVKADVSNIIKNPETYCTTTWIKNDMIEKLRHRQSDYPVTFRFKKKGSIRHRRCHEYKFNASERREFMRIAKTGLNKEGRRLKRLMKRVSVVLYRVKPSVIEEWRKPKPKPIWIDDDISIVEIEPAPGSSSSFFGGHNVSNNHYLNHRAGPSNQLWRQEPRPQFLVKKDQRSSELLFLPLAGQNRNIFPYSNSCMQSRSDMGPANRRKQNFSQLRTDLSLVDSLQNGSSDSNRCFPFNYGVSNSRSNLNGANSNILDNSILKHHLSSDMSENIPALDFSDPKIFSRSLNRPGPLSSKTSNYSRPGPLSSKRDFKTSRPGPLSSKQGSNHQPGNSLVRSNSIRPDSPNVLNPNAYPHLQKNLLQPLNQNAFSQRNIAPKPSASGSLAISSVYSISSVSSSGSAVSHSAVSANLNIQIGQIGSLTGGTESQVAYPTGIKPNEYLTNIPPNLSLSNVASCKSLSVSKMAEYVVEKNVDSDTNEVVEVICIEDDD